jgi:hypothetical protein
LVSETETYTQVKLTRAKMFVTVGAWGRNHSGRMKTHSGNLAHLTSVLSALLLCLFFIQQARAASWVTNSPMATARRLHTATLLSTGKVLVVGGVMNSTYGTTSAELYDPATGTWMVTGSMSAARWGHAATLLLNGEVLVVGGINGHTNFFSAELYNPVTGRWRTTGAYAAIRNHTATLLHNGNVLVAGGRLDGNSFSNASLYYPAIGSWGLTGDMEKARDGHTATLLQNGKVMVLGGD